MPSPYPSTSKTRKPVPRFVIETLAVKKLSKFIGNELLWATATGFVVPASMLPPNAKVLSVERDHAKCGINIVFRLP